MSTLECPRAPWAFQVLTTRLLLAASVAKTEGKQGAHGGLATARGATGHSRVVITRLLVAVLVARIGPNARCPRKRVMNTLECPRAPWAFQVLTARLLLAASVVKTGGNKVPMEALGLPVAPLGIPGCSLLASWWPFLSLKLGQSGILITPLLVAVVGRKSCSFSARCVPVVVSLALLTRRSPQWWAADTTLLTPRLPQWWTADISHGLLLHFGQPFSVNRQQDNVVPHSQK